MVQCTWVSCKTDVCFGVNSPNFGHSPTQSQKKNLFNHGSVTLIFVNLNPEKT